MASQDSRTLFITNVGSHMWQMNRPDSDVDLFECYMVPTRSILRGNSRQNSHFHPGAEVDVASHEIGKVIEMLIKGNVNFVCGVMSPITTYDNAWCLDELRSIVRKNISKNIYKSVNGRATSNYKKYIKRGKDASHKRMALIMRTLRFGREVLRSGEFVFRPVQPDEHLTADSILTAIELLIDEYEHSSLPDHPDEKPYRDFLYNLRYNELMGSL